MSVGPHMVKRRRNRQYQLQELGFESYAAYLHSAYWKELKARYRASDLPQACRCGSEDVQYHHKTYERLGAEELTDLEPLCRECHALVHALERRGDMGLDPGELDSPERAAEYAQERAPAEAKADAEFNTDERRREQVVAGIERRIRTLKHLRARLLRGEDVDAELAQFGIGAPDTQRSRDLTEDGPADANERRAQGRAPT